MYKSIRDDDRVVIFLNVTHDLEKTTSSLKSKVSNSLLFNVDSYQNKWSPPPFNKFKGNNIN